MKYQFVFIAKKAGMIKSEAVDLCFHSGYKFLLFNGIVFFVADPANVYKTDLCTNDLF